MVKPHLREVVRRTPDLIVIAALCALSANINSLLTVWKRPFRLDDPDISYRHMAKDIVPSETLTYIAAVAPIFLVMLLTLIWSFMKHQPIYTQHTTLRVTKGPLFMFYAFLFGFACSHLFTNIATYFIKFSVGRLRPDFLDRCAPSLTHFNVTMPLSYYSVGNATHNPLIPAIFYTESICTGNPKVMLDGRLSFPSGHASTAFAGFVYLALFLFTILVPKLLEHKKWQLSTGQAIRMVAVFVPVGIATYVTVSRLQQNVHNQTDVLGGSLIGTFFAFLFWYLYIVKETSEYVYFQYAKEKDDSLRDRLYAMENGLLKSINSRQSYTNSPDQYTGPAEIDYESKYSPFHSMSPFQSQRPSIPFIYTPNQDPIPESPLESSTFVLN